MVSQFDDTGIRSPLAITQADTLACPPLRHEEYTMQNV